MKKNLILNICFGMLFGFTFTQAMQQDGDILISYFEKTLKNIEMQENTAGLLKCFDAINFGDLSEEEKQSIEEAFDKKEDLLYLIENTCKEKLKLSARHNIFKKRIIFSSEIEKKVLDSKSYNLYECIHKISSKLLNNEYAVVSFKYLLQNGDYYFKDLQKKEKQAIEDIESIVLKGGSSKIVRFTAPYKGKLYTYFSIVEEGFLMEQENLDKKYEIVHIKNDKTNIMFYERILGLIYYLNQN